MDVYELDVGRLCNVAYAALIDEAGPLADRGQVRERVDALLRRPPSRKAGKSGPRRGLSVAQAKRMAADLEGYDSKIKGGRLLGDG